MRLLVRSVILFATLCSTAVAQTDEQVRFFENEIRPLLVQRCVKCHGPKKREAGLRLDHRDGLLAGGDSGSAIVAGSPNDSLLISAVERNDGLEMPPDEPLEAREVEALRKWVKAGAIWPAAVDARQPHSDIRSGPITDEERAFWSFQPVVKPGIPQVENEAWCRNPIDHFVKHRLEHDGLPASPDASARKLVRRAFFDLHGLPPDPQQINDYLASDPDDRFAALVDELLESPHYGERWGRHWLDVVRYADTAGETADFPVPLAWRYRNYVIDSFNNDKPYNDFVREQIAGDILAQKNPKRWEELVTATGYLAISRRFGFGTADFMYLTLQDTIDTTGQAFLGLSLGCARCHDHKYDPVLVGDYYSWFGIFDSTKFALSGDEKTKTERDFVPLIPFQEAERLDADRAARTKDLTERLTQVDVEIKATEQGIPKSAGPLSGDMEEYPLGGLLTEPWDTRGGVISPLAQSPFNNVNPPGTRGLRTRNDDGNNGCGCKLPPRTAKTHEFLYLNLDIRNVHEDRKATGSSRVYIGQGPGLSPAVVCHFVDRGFAISRGNRVERIADVALNTWYNLQITVNLRTRKYSGALRSKNSGVLFDDIDFVPNWNGTVDVIFVDGHGLRYGVRPLQDLDNFTLRTEPLLSPEQSIAPDSPDTKALVAKRRRLEQLSKQAAKLRAEQESLSNRPYEVAYAVREGAPHESPVHKRGDPDNLSKTTAARRHLEILGGQPISNPGSTSGRLDLANWLAAAENPLTARVIVNRIWQYHFGHAIVTTPNDFGRRGAAPSHPALLDWLAAELIENDWSIKHIHRLIMTSRTYQLSSQAVPELPPQKEQQRTNNFGRFRHRRLDAESIRDAMLAVSGRLDREPGEGHPFPPSSSWAFTQHAPFYAVYPTTKRSVYVMRQRLQAHPFFQLFDAADPNVSTATRTDTTTPTQALFLMNNPFVHENAEALARRAAAAAPDETARITWLYRTTLGRDPLAVEVSDSSGFLGAYRQQAADNSEEKAWAALCRTLLVSNEFLHTE